ncbi:Hypp2016 [Branchiostoma lanceolatum]|uniref:Hypp2016 protein n=1 Tax=Branchiostoma lanceolatum TaxID=7740 RepID=A0A8J9ZQJ0_BRALA|nr:Hypp2016 [Branchiostoma lanceolatum]
MTGKMHRFFSVPELSHHQERGTDGRKFSDRGNLGTDRSKMSTSQKCVQQVVDNTSRDEDGALLLADIERVAGEISILERSIDSIAIRSRPAAGLFWPMLSLNIHQLSEQLSSAHSALNRLGRDKVVVRTLRQQLRDTEMKLESLAKDEQKVGDTVGSSRQVLLQSKCGGSPEEEGPTEMLQKDAVEEWLRRAEQGSTSSHHLQGAVEDHLRKERERSKIMHEELTAIKDKYEKNVSLKVTATTPVHLGELATMRALLKETENRQKHESDQNRSLQEDIASLRQVQEEKDVQKKELEEEVAFLQKMLQEADERFDAELTESTFTNGLHTANNTTGRRHMSLETLNEGKEGMTHSSARRSLSFEDAETVKTHTECHKAK